MPFGGYENFAACTAANKDKRDPEAYCGHIKHQVEGNKELPNCLYCHNPLYKSEILADEGGPGSGRHRIRPDAMTGHQITTIPGTGMRGTSVPGTTVPGFGEESKSVGTTMKNSLIKIGKELAKAGYTEAGPADPTPPFASARAPPGSEQQGQPTAQPQQVGQQPSVQEEPQPNVGSQAHSDPALSQPGAGAAATQGTEAAGGMDSSMSSAVGAGSSTMGAGSATSPQEAAAQAQPMQPPQMVVADPAEHYPGIVQGLDTARKYLIEVSQRFLALGEQQKAQAIDKLVNSITQEHGNASTQQSIQQARTAQAGAGKAELPKPVSSPTAMGGASTPSPVIAQGM